MAKSAVHVQAGATGLRDLGRALKDAGRGESRREITKANRRAAAAAVPSVRRGAPERSGALRGSVRALASQTRGQIAVGTPSKVPYAGPINFGWKARNIAPQEFIYSGIDDATDAILDEYDQAIDELFDSLFAQGIGR